jgi:hypothetical protein
MENAVSRVCRYSWLLPTVLALHGIHAIVWDGRTHILIASGHAVAFGLGVGFCYVCDKLSERVSKK